LYSGAKKPAKFICLVFKLLQMNLPKEIATEYLKARDYKYLNAIALLYLRLILKGSEAY
jgi:pre-mRNA-splicing factor 38A